MGWLFKGGYTKSDMIQDLTKSEEHDGTRLTCIAHHTHGNTLWAVWERQPGGEREIVCYLLERDPDGWGYKDIPETSGPAYYTCPLSYLDMVPTPDSQYAGPWREEVRAYHARTRQTLTVGQTIRLEHCTVPEITITSVRPLKGTYNGVLYSLPRKYLPDPTNTTSQVGLTEG